MVNVIELVEQDNRLDFLNTYKPIVCGNSNYVFRFKFSPSWNRFKRKTVVFMIEDKKQLVDFESNECRVPIMPNAPFVFVALMCGGDGEQLVTTSLKIRMESSVGASRLEDYKDKNDSLAKLMASVIKIENGELTAQKSKIAENVVNKNYLINSNFCVNQRGCDFYESVDDNQVFSVDRWSVGGCAKLFKLSAGVRLVLGSQNAIFRQKIEFANELAGQTVTVSAKISNARFDRVSRVLQAFQYGAESGEKQPSVNIAGNGVVSCTVALKKDLLGLDVRIVSYAGGFEVDEFDVEWVKLEIGENATPYVPERFDEELAACRRFFYKSQNNHICKFARNGYQFYDNVIGFDFMRIVPSITIFSANDDTPNCLKCGSANVEVLCLNGTNNSFHVQAAGGKLVPDGVYKGRFVLDAELY